MKSDKTQRVVRTMLTKYNQDPFQVLPAIRLSAINPQLDLLEASMIAIARPKASVLKQFDEWVNVYGYGINRGAKGIPTLRIAEQLNASSCSPRYYFDQADTRVTLFSQELTPETRSFGDLVATNNYLKIDTEATIDAIASAITQDNDPIRRACLYLASVYEFYMATPDETLPGAFEAIKEAVHEPLSEMTSSVEGLKRLASGINRMIRPIFEHHESETQSLTNDGATVSNSANLKYLHVDNTKEEYHVDTKRDPDEPIRTPQTVLPDGQLPARDQLHGGDRGAGSTPASIAGGSEGALRDHSGATQAEEGDRQHPAQRGFTAVGARNDRSEEDSTGDSGKRDDLRETSSHRDVYDYDKTTDPGTLRSPSERLKNNLAALRLLKTLETQTRHATPDEQKILAQYVGWGGLSDVFEEKNSSRAEVRNELKELLTPFEYDQARSSVLTSFYTDSALIETMYDALSSFGFDGDGTILEPSCGIGNFLGMIPAKWRETSDINAVELDPLSGKMAQQLYQSAKVKISGYEKAEIEPNSIDIAVGNVPFGDYGVHDPQFASQGFKIHDYFFAKTLENLRPGGVLAFITSKGTLDKQDSSVRSYLAQKADLIGAIRLPDNAFKSAGTQVTSDIIFLQKREEELLDASPLWVKTREAECGMPMNAYFCEHPEMIAGTIVVESGPYGSRLACKADASLDLKDCLREAISHMSATIGENAKRSVRAYEDHIIHAPDKVANLTYCIHDGKVMFRDGAYLVPSGLNKKAEERVRGMVGIRSTLKELLDTQRTEDGDERSDALRAKLNDEYDSFVKRNGYLNSKANRLAFGEDTTYDLLCSIEDQADEADTYRKAKIMETRVLRPAKPIEHVDTAEEALAVSLSEKGGVDLEFMEGLSSIPANDLIKQLEGQIFVLPETLDWSKPSYVEAAEYLSGNVRRKLTLAREYASVGELDSNIRALEEALPAPILAEEIKAPLGTTWIPDDVVQEFVYELCGTPVYNRATNGNGNLWRTNPQIKVSYVPEVGQWNISAKSAHRSTTTTSEYGTGALSAYEIIERTLNMNPLQVMKTVFVDGVETKVLDKEATASVLGKQSIIREKFSDWLYADPERRERLVNLYNERFNSLKLREYDGSHLVLHGANIEVKLRKHQKDAVNRILHGGNTLLGHCVGAGKTYEMIAGAQESKYLGLCSKSLFVVPNHLTGQWGAEYLKLYPAAKVLVATKKDFQKQNRRRLFAKMATGDYDAVIIGHSQFEKIPLSDERQKAFYEAEHDSIMAAWKASQDDSGSDNFTVKALERKKKQIEAKIEALEASIAISKDAGLTFELMGFDRLFVDEAHEYKNLEFTTKMSRVAGVNSTGSVKASDMLMKTRYINEITDGKGIVFASGTPISNSVVEMFSLQRYLQPELLADAKIDSFDAWASSFTEQVSGFEINPTGTGFRNHTRLSRYNNLPELLTMFSMTADIKTADMISLPVPKANYKVISTEPTTEQKSMVEALGQRADVIHSGSVDPRIDNMLKITHEGRELALDQRTRDPLLPDDPASKIATAADNIHRIYDDHNDQKATQIVFCDISTPGAENFCAYDDLKSKLMERGIPEDEIAFIHDANTDTQKEHLFERVREGDVRVLIGSTAKMGTGTNVQDRLIASHDLDCPWRPSDLEQRAGRTIRQGNRHDEVEVYRYVTKGTFDSYLYQMVETKQKFISQIMCGKMEARSVEDLDDSALKYAEIKAIATGDPQIKEKLELDNKIAELRLQKSAWQKESYRIEVQATKILPNLVAAITQRIEKLKVDVASVENTRIAVKEDGRIEPITIHGQRYTKRNDAAESLTNAVRAIEVGQEGSIGELRGFKLSVKRDWATSKTIMVIAGQDSYEVALGGDPTGNLIRVENRIEQIVLELSRAQEDLAKAQIDLTKAQSLQGSTFKHDAELNDMLARSAELATTLNLDGKGSEEAPVAQDMEQDPGYERIIIEADAFDRDQLAFIRKVLKANKEAENNTFDCNQLLEHPEYSIEKMRKVYEACSNGLSKQTIDFIKDLNEGTTHFRLATNALLAGANLQDVITLSAACEAHADWGHYESFYSMSWAAGFCGAGKPFENAEEILEVIEECKRNSSPYSFVRKLYEINDRVKLGERIVPDKQQEQKTELTSLADMVQLASRAQEQQPQYPLTKGKTTIAR